MITPPPGVRVYLACGYTDMRKGIASLAMLVQQTLGHDPFICVAQEYVAAQPNSAAIHAEGRNLRHIRSVDHRSWDALVEVHRALYQVMPLSPLICRIGQVCRYRFMFFNTASQ